MNNKRFAEYEKVFFNETSSINIINNAKSSIKQFFESPIKDGEEDTEIIRMDCALLVIMNCVLGNSTPSYECSDELREELEKTELGYKINQMTEYLLPLPLIQWGDLSTNPDTASSIFDPIYDINKVEHFYERQWGKGFRWIGSEFNLAPEDEGIILRKYLKRKLDDAIAQQDICLAQIEMKNLADDEYKKILETDSPLVIIYKDLLTIVDTILARMQD